MFQDGVDVTGVRHSLFLYSIKENKAFALIILRIEMCLSVDQSRIDKCAIC